ncbi:tetratricopeptide repeat protein [Neptunomonas concharum]|nr:tetratricopeptide repeat protein [Neptunomonas concharum]
MMKHSEKWISKAMALLAQGKLGQAKAIATKILKESPKHYQANLLLGVIYLKLGDNEQAIPLLQVAVQTARTATEKVQALNNLSLPLSSTNRLDDALQAINEAIAIKPTQAIFYCNRANLHEKLQNWHAMQEDLQQALSIDAEIEEAIISLSVCLRKQKRLNEALNLLDAHPLHEPDWHNEWVLLCCLTGNAQRALDWISQQPSTKQELLIGIADYAAEQGDLGIACQLYEALLKRWPDNQRLLHPYHSLAGIPSDRAPREYVTSLYNQHAEQFNQRLLDTLGYRVPERLATRLASFLPSSPIHVLDLGCGTGLAGQELGIHAQLKSLIGVDLSEQMLKQAELTGVYSHLVQEDIFDYLHTRPKVDLILATDVLIYIGALSPLFKQVSHCLTQQGIFAFSTEACDNDWQLTPSGRFQHSLSHVLTLAKAHHFQLLHHEPCVIRSEHDQPVHGEIYIFKTI